MAVSHAGAGAVLLLIAATAPASSQTYQATVVRVVDGDSVIVSVPAWAATPFGTMSVRISGIDTPESRKPPAKCKAEVALGKAASAYAKTLVQPGAPVVLTLKGWDKYFRLDGALTLPDGRDWGSVMLVGGYAAPYDGGKKRSWCRKAPKPPVQPTSAN